MISIQLHTRQFQEVKSHFINRHINSLLPRGKIPPATDKRQLPRLTIKSNVRLHHCVLFYAFCFPVFPVPTSSSPPSPPLSVSSSILCQSNLCKSHSIFHQSCFFFPFDLPMKKPFPLFFSLRKMVKDCLLDQ